MSRLTYLDASTATQNEIRNVLDQDGAVVLENALAPRQAASILSELEPYIEGTKPFDDDFVGRATTRTGGLVARSRTAREAITHPVVLEAANRFLTPYSENIQLNVTQIMRILPGETPQALHRDRYIWSRSLPREIEPQFNGIWALTEFTEENGATRVIPGSQHWDWDRKPTENETIPVRMSLGSVLLYTGSVLHGGGANRSTSPRIGMNITYVLGWLRQEENQYLSCPPEVARTLEPELQRLIGYSVGNGSLGYYSSLEPPNGRVDTLPPELAVGGKAGHSEQRPF